MSLGKPNPAHFSPAVGTRRAAQGIARDTEGSPVNAIDRRNPRIVDKEKHIACIHCLKTRPKNARRKENPRMPAAINRLKTLFTTRRNPDIFI